jgi:hypothetical protein
MTNNIALRLFKYCLCLGSLLSLARGTAYARSDPFIWIDVPYDFSSPGVVLPGATNCSDSASGSGEVHTFYNNVFGKSSFGSGRINSSSTCSSGPTIYAPPSSSRRMLRVHVDCVNKTYDAKGDSMGWKSWDQEQAVYRVAVFACAEKGFGSADGAKVVTEEEIRRIVNTGLFTYEWCISASLQNISTSEKALHMNPGSMGLGPAQAFLYINKLRSAVPLACEKAQQVISRGGGYDAIQATVWSPVLAEALESAIRIGR